MLVLLYCCHLVRLCYALFLQLEQLRQALHLPHLSVQSMLLIALIVERLESVKLTVRATIVAMTEVSQTLSGASGKVSAHKNFPLGFDIGSSTSHILPKIIMRGITWLAPSITG